MSKFIGMLKSNTGLALCMGAIVLAVAGAAYAFFLQGPGIKGQLSKSDGEINKLKSLETVSALIPPDDPNGQANSVNLTPNPANIERLKGIYQQLNNQQGGIESRAIAQNKQNHDPFSPDVFGGAKPNPNSANVINAHDTAEKKFFELYALLKAGEPQESKEIVEKLGQIKKQFASTIQRMQLTPAEIKELRGKQREELMNLFTTRARSIMIYAEKPVFDANQKKYSGVFQIGDWITKRKQPGQGAPNSFELWEGQMQLWIQSDIVRAILLANDAGGNAAANVTTNPVKRVLGIEVKPYYYGLPQGGYTKDVKPVALGPKDPLKSYFGVSSTGRICNEIYDVRHARLSVIVDSRRVPALINAIGKVNFMTVLGVKMTDVDEYDHLRYGYVYGDGATVQLELDIETIWMRKWTSELMPDDMRAFLGIKPRDANYSWPSDQLPGRPEGFDPAN